jgi:hypothetical protein
MWPDAILGVKLKRTIRDLNQLVRELDKRGWTVHWGYSQAHHMTRPDTTQLELKVERKETLL